MVLFLEVCEILNIYISLSVEFVVRLLGWFGWNFIYFKEKKVIIILFKFILVINNEIICFIVNI